MKEIELMNQKKLQSVEIEKNIGILKEYFSFLTNDQQYKPSDREKFKKWVLAFEKIFRQISLFDKNVLPVIETDLNYPFFNRDLVLTAIMQPSVKNPFSEIKKQFGNESEFVISQSDLDLLERCSDVSGSLAWMGDAAIHYAISKNIWEPEITMEELDKKRKSLESDDNLSKLCDTWKLYDNRIHFDPPVPKHATINEIKGTLVEAIYGVIFIEQGFEGVQEAIDLIYQ
jgi:dsRNA-specific ribonuclease